MKHSKEPNRKQRSEQTKGLMRRAGDGQVDVEGLNHAGMAM